MPVRMVTRSRTVRWSVTHGSYAWNSGRCCRTRSSHPSFPSLASAARVVTVNDLLMEAMRNLVSGVTGVPAARSRTP